MPTFFENQTTATSVEIDWSGNKPGSFQVDGVWGGATITFYGSLNDGTKFLEPEANGSYTSDVIGEFEMGTGKVKAVLTNPGATTSLNCYLSPG